jgi:hypothetical protein
LIKPDVSAFDEASVPAVQATPSRSGMQTAGAERAANESGSNRRREKRLRHRAKSRVGNWFWLQEFQIEASPALTGAASSRLWCSTAPSIARPSTPMPKGF